MFDISERLIADNSFEMVNLSTMMYDFSPWTRMTLYHDQMGESKVHVYSDLLCLGRISQPSEANIKWKEHIHFLQQSNENAVGVGFQCSVVRVGKVSVTYFPVVAK